MRCSCILLPQHSIELTAGSHVHDRREHPRPLTPVHRSGGFPGLLAAASREEGTVVAREDVEMVCGESGANNVVTCEAKTFHSLWGSTHDSGARQKSGNECCARESARKKTRFQAKEARFASHVAPSSRPSPAVPPWARKGRKEPQERNSRALSVCGGRRLLGTGQGLVSQPPCTT